MRALTSIIGLVVVGSCAGDGANGDRAGGLAQWHLAPTPVFSVGRLEGPEDQLLSGIRDVELLDDGAVLIADAGSHSIRIYGLDGELRARFGAEGQGPGEFGYLWAAWLQSPDTVGVLDLNSLRWVLFHRNGEVIDTRRLVPGEGVGDLFEGGFSDGSFVLARLQYPEEIQDGMGMGMMPHSLITPEGVFGRRLAETGGVLFYVPSGSPSSNPMPGSATAWHPFSPDDRGLVSSDTFYIGLGLESKVQLYTKEGALAREVQLAMPRLRVAEATRLLDSARVALGRATPLSGAPEVDRVPAFMGLFVEDEGRIWAREYRPETDSPWVRESGPNALRNYGGTWWIFSRDGDPLARMNVPHGFHLEDVRGSLVAGVEVDQLGVERVRVYRIEER